MHTSAKRFRFVVVALTFALLLQMLAATVVIRPAVAADRDLAVAPAGGAFDRTWARTDKPVRDNGLQRTWMWGPEANTGTLTEPYAESPNGQRTVQYFDKSRMEDNAHRGTNPWDVTNGLLVVELITGQRQIGDNQFEPGSPAQVNVAGDGDDANGPTYATFTNLRGAAPLNGGSTITQRVNRAGAVSDDSSLASHGVTAAHFASETNHQVASPFWTFMNSSGSIYENGAYTSGQLFETSYYATGLPITEAYWANVKVGGSYRDVLMQCFERRCLTYTPGNPTEWQVEAGNVGQHYHTWRYDGPSTGEELASGSIDSESGGTIETAGMSLSFPPGSLSNDTTVTIYEANGAGTSQLGSEFTMAGQGIDVDLGGASLDGVAQVAFRVEPSILSNPDIVPVILGQDPGTGQPVPLETNGDASTGWMTAETTHFSFLLPSFLDLNAWVQNVLTLRLDRIAKQRATLDFCDLDGHEVSITGQGASPIWGCVTREPLDQPAVVTITNLQAFGFAVDSNSTNSPSVPHHKYIGPGDTFEISVDTTKPDSPIGLVPIMDGATWFEWVARIGLSFAPAGLDVLSDQARADTLAAIIAPKLDEYGDQSYQEFMKGNYQKAAELAVKTFTEGNRIDAIFKVGEHHGWDKLLMNWISWTFKTIIKLAAWIPTKLLSIIAVIHGAMGHIAGYFAWAFTNPSLTISWDTGNARPIAPTNLDASPVSTTQIRLTWEDKSNNEDGFKIFGSAGTFIGEVGANQTTYTVGNLSANNEHCYKVQAWNGAGVSAFTPNACATTQQGVPSAPSNLEAYGGSEETSGAPVPYIDLYWDDNSNNESEFRIYYAPPGSASWQFERAVAAGSTYLRDYNVGFGETWCYTIRAFNSAGESSGSNSSCGTTPGGGSPPNAPSNLTASTVDSTTIELEWHDNSSNEDGFYIYFEDSNSPIPDTDGSDPCGVGCTLRHIVNLAPDSYHCFNVSAHNGFGESARSNTACAWTGAGETVPAAPSGLYIGYDSGSEQYFLGWQDNANNETGFEVWAGTYASGFIDTHLGNAEQDGWFYWLSWEYEVDFDCYEVRAFNNEWYSGWSNQVCWDVEVNALTTEPSAGESIYSSGELPASDVTQSLRVTQIRIGNTPTPATRDELLAR